MSRRLVAEGWRSYVRNIMNKAAGPIQIEETRCAFYSGANHLFHSLLRCLDPKTEATNDDLAQIRTIHDELDEFVSDSKKKHRP